MSRPSTSSASSSAVSSPWLKGSTNHSMPSTCSSSGKQGFFGSKKGDLLGQHSWGQVLVSKRGPTHCAQDTNTSTHSIRCTHCQHATTALAAAPAADCTHLWPYHEVCWQVDAGHGQAYTCSNLHIHQGQADSNNNSSTRGHRQQGVASQANMHF